MFEASRATAVIARPRYNQSEFRREAVYTFWAGV